MSEVSPGRTRNERRKLLPMKRIALSCIFLALLVYPDRTQAQHKVYPHLQVFLVASEARGRTPFIAFWDAAHRLAAGPFPVRMLEVAGLNVSLDLTYQKPNEDLPSAAGLKVTKGEASSSQEQQGAVDLDQMADRIVNRGVSDIFPDWPFLIIGHNKASEGVLWVGRIMKEIQNEILACHQKYRVALEATLNSMKGTASYGHALRVVESAFPSCPF